MKKTLIVLIALATASWGLNSYVPPDAGGRASNAFVITVTDNDVDAAWELIDAARPTDSTFVPMSTDTTIGVGYANQTWYDSLAAGNNATGTILGVWLLSNSTEKGASNNWLSANGVPAYSTGIFGNCYSSKVGTNFLRNADADFRLATSNFTLAFWAKSAATANPSAIQTLFSTYTSPDRVKVRYLTSGKLNLSWSDGSTPSVLCPTGVDSLSTTADVYDSTWHYYAVQRASTVLSLYQDGTRVANTTIVNTGSVDPDTVQIGALRSATRFVGKIDEMFYVKAAIDTMLLKYAYTRGIAPDSALVHLTGIKDADSTYIRQTVTVLSATPGTSTVNFHAFENAWLDTTEQQPLLVYKTTSVPRSALLDSIPINSRWSPIGHRFFGKDEQPVIERVSFIPSDSTSVEVQLRVYSDCNRGVSYTNNYYVAGTGMVGKNANPVELDFGKADEGRGLYIGPNSYVAGYAKGATANSSITMTLRGVRKR